jgi:hypothetical protein
MIDVVLGNTYELCVRGIGWLRHQWFIQTVRVEGEDRTPQIAIQRSKNTDCVLPCCWRRRGNCVSIRWTS